MEGEIFAALVAVAIAAGCIDTLAGGGGLLVVPALLAAGLQPQATLATSKLQATAGSLTASLTFLRRGEVRLRDMAPAIAFSFAGSALGTGAITLLDAAFLRHVVPILLIAIALYTLFGRIGPTKTRPPRLGKLPFAGVFGLGLGFYDGFFGPGTGSFWAAAYVAFRGYDLRRATVETKLVNCASNVASLLIFAASGQVVWLLGLAMALGQFIGARAGALMVLGSGARLIRPLLVVMSLAITIRPIAADPDTLLRVLAVGLWHWLFG